MKTQTQQQAFNELVAKFGRKPKSHLFPIWNYFFIPQTTAQWKTWYKSITGGIYAQNLLLNADDFELVKAFYPQAEMKKTKSGMIRVLNFVEFAKEVKKFVK